MSAEVYEVIAQAMRYWFLFLMALIVWRSYRWYRRDRRERKKRLRLLPDAGYVGELVVTDGGGVLKAGEALPVPREGTLGFLRTNDVCVPVDGVKNKHLWFSYDDDRGLLIEPYQKNRAEVDGEAFISRRDPLNMAHGSRLRVGAAELRLRLFAGFEVAAQAPARGFADEREQGGDAAAYGAGMAYAYPPPTPEQLIANQRMWAYWQAAWMAAQGQPGAYPNTPTAPEAAQPVLSPEQYGSMMAWLASGQSAQYNIGDNNESGNAADNAAAAGAFTSYQAYRAWAEHRQSGDAGYDETADYGEEDYGDDADYDEAFDSDNRASAYAPTRAAATDDAYAAPTNQTVLSPEDGFYPLEGISDDDDTWPYAPNPDYPAEDDDLTDAMQPPRSAYIGHDDAELAKKKVWDRYLGRGRRR